jgi:hypothetical protein
MSGQAAEGWNETPEVNMNGQAAESGNEATTANMSMQTIEMYVETSGDAYGL